MKNNYFVQAWLVLALSLAFGAALAGVDSSLKDKIAANKLEQTEREIPALLLGPNWEQEYPNGSPLTSTKPEVGGRDVYQCRDLQGALVGWVIPASGQGFAGPIELLIGLNADATTITGIYVLAQTETPALGDNIKKQSFRGQYAGKNTATPVEVVKTAPQPGSNQIQAVSGATVSSNSVTAIVNETVTAMREALANAAEAATTQPAETAEMPAATPTVTESTDTEQGQ